MDKEREISKIILEIRESHLGNDTFKNVAQKIVNSEAIRKCDDKELEIILIDLMLCVFEKTKGKMVKTYSNHRHFNTEHIKAQLYACSLPLLDFSIK